MKSWVIQLLLLFILVLVCGCTGHFVRITSTPAPKEFSSEPDVYFCPQEHCREYLVELIRTAERTVHCAFYDINLEEVVQALIDKENITKLVVGRRAAWIKEMLKNVRSNDGNQLMHDKFCVIDGDTVVTGSFNPTEKDNFFNNNNMIVIHSKYLAQNYEDEFKELWDGNFGSGNRVKTPIIYLNNMKIENYFCPEDSCKSRIKAVLEKAEKCIYFMTFTFTDDEIGDVLIDKSKDIVVKGIMEKNNRNEWSEYWRFKSNGMDVKLDENRYNLHHKVFIVDNKIVITGSFNPTRSGNEMNDENILILHDEDVAKEYSKEFDKLWNYKDTMDLEEKDTRYVMISEVYYDTKGRDSDEEFVELYNPSDERINLDYFFLSNGRRTQRLRGFIEPNSTRVIKLGFLLRNDGDLLVLKEGLKQLDYVSWESSWDLEARTGQSLQRSGFSRANSRREWKVGTPTPGKV